MCRTMTDYLALRTWQRLVLPPHAAWTTRLLGCLYGGPERVYHTLSHIDECLTLLDAVTEPVSRALADLAVVMHDAVYVPGHIDNELNSVALVEGLRFTLKDSLLATHVVPAIFATRHKDEEGAFGDTTVAAVVDVDLAVLGRDETGYAKYVDEIRREFGHVSDDAWRVGRGGFLSKTLRRGRIYTLESMRERFEIQARINMETELRSLGGT
jgi:predicted metal-dependent HD superfamily phosphohydrolase